MRECAIIGVILFAIVLGCQRQDPHGRQPLVGKVVFQGTPLERGVIEFLPLESPQRAGTRGIIRNGEFAIPREQGVPPGRYRVVITSPQSNANEPLVGPPGMQLPPLGKELIPAQYNSESQVVAEVTAEGEGRFDYAIP